MLKDGDIKDLFLAEIEEILQYNGKSLNDYPPMTFFLIDFVTNFQSRLITEKLNFECFYLSQSDRSKALKEMRKKTTT